MSRSIYGMDKCPLENKPPEFKYEHTDAASQISIEFGIGEDDYKTECQSYIDINSDIGGSYPLQLSVKLNNEWQTVEATAVRVQIFGSYERNGFIYALQKAGLMTVPFYGIIKDYWEE